MENGRRKRNRRRKRSKNPSQSLSEEVQTSSPHHPNPKRRKSDADRGTSTPRSNHLSVSKPTSFLDKMRARLRGGHFRMINEKLYTCSGSEALNLFKEDPALFNVYHTGYQEQMSHWPEQPVNIIIKWLKGRSPSLTVADFGCGDAPLARNVKNKVFSIDLVSNDPSIIACDMSNTPLDSSSVDVAVFCLSLMGTNFPKYLQEAHRVLKPSGWLLIAEIRSRFDRNNGGADPEKFSNAVQRLGFASISKDFSNKMFVLFYFKKKAETSREEDIEWPELKPCLYKRR
ncbi:S-adenosyl-L-methionine-dependent methyltransferases superfamily protein isoform X2 [Tasmannia lanceolata]|uniref:S-adenosyl-L-methionine-dependent methyltransferases superfamily protein isoform X2 n=1 Tax=Tasmannia lanceolata TaxID=3420 RepID=UPI0040643BC6